MLMRFFNSRPIFSDNAVTPVSSICKCLFLPIQGYKGSKGDMGMPGASGDKGTTGLPGLPVRADILYQETVHVGYLE